MRHWPTIVIVLLFTAPVIVAYVSGCDSMSTHYVIEEAVSREKMAACKRYRNVQTKEYIKFKNELKVAGYPLDEDEMAEFERMDRILEAAFCGGTYEN